MKNVFQINCTILAVPSFSAPSKHRQRTLMHIRLENGRRNEVNTKFLC